jgi:nucleotide-binding universal stress UspA family protein
MAELPEVPLAHDDEKSQMHNAMSIPNIVAFLTSSTPWSPAAVMGASLASRHGSVLTGCFVDPILRDFGVSDVESTIPALVRDHVIFDMPSATDFMVFANQNGVARTNWAALQVDVEGAITQLAAWHDLAVVESDMMEVHELLTFLTHLLWACRLPCVLLPRRCADLPPFERIVIGWNGSPQATRAIHAAMPFLPGAKEVWILDGADEDGEDNPDMPRFDPYRFLAQHGVEARRRRFDRDVGIVGGALIWEAQQLRADLFVLGAFSHSRLRERVAGGVFRCMLENAKIPLLLQH